MVTPIIAVLVLVIVMLCVLGGVVAVTSCPHSVDISSVCSIYSVSTVSCVDSGGEGGGVQDVVTGRCYPLLSSALASVFAAPRIIDGALMLGSIIHDTMC